MDMFHFLERLNLIIALAFTAIYLYQGFYLVLGFLRRHHQVRYEPSCEHRFAAVIAARNEEGVIAELIGCLKQQKYPADLLDVYVVADNCTDHTAQVAREAGALVYERHDQVHKGKGYAMDFLFHQLEQEGKADYDGYMVFDADNLVDPHFVHEMNKVFDRGYDAVTCYRNSKNFGQNWISAGYSIWFLREARFLNFPRMLLRTNCHVSGTGFLISAKLVEKNGGWPFHLLTEDIEFSVNCAIQGNTIGYCEKAIVYDEQPTTFQQSWDQRLRWSKGFYQVDRDYGPALIKGCLRGGRKGTSCYDMLVTVAPGMLLTLVLLALNTVMVVACFTQPAYWANRILGEAMGFIGGSLLSFYVGMFAYGLLTVLCEWKRIQATPSQKLRYLVTFPIFMLTYIPISVAALVRQVEWKPIYHTASAAAARQGQLNNL